MACLRYTARIAFTRLFPITIPFLFIKSASLHLTFLSANKRKVVITMGVFPSDNFWVAAICWHTKFSLYTADLFLHLRLKWPNPYRLYFAVWAWILPRSVHAGSEQGPQWADVNTIMNFRVLLKNSAPCSTWVNPFERKALNDRIITGS